MLSSWLGFSKDVLLQSPRSVEDCVRSLQSLTSPPNSFSRDARRLPFRGKVDAAGGVLRLPYLSITMRVGVRALHFKLVACSSGTELQGQWRLIMWVQIYAYFCFALCLAGAVFGLVHFLLYGPNQLVRDLLAPVIGFAVVYGWARGAIWTGRKSEGQIVNAISHSMASDESANIVREVLSGTR